MNEEIEVQQIPEQSAASRPATTQRVLQQRKKRSAQAVANQRANRAAAKAAKDRKREGEPAPSASRFESERFAVANFAVVGGTGLSLRQQRLLTTVSGQLFAQGVIDPKYLGIRFLELFALNWTPLRYVWYDGKAQLVGEWMTDSEFEEVWLWWCGLHYESRNAIMHRESMRV